MLARLQECLLSCINSHTVTSSGYMCEKLASAVRIRSLGSIILLLVISELAMLSHMGCIPLVISSKLFLELQVDSEY